MGKPEIRFKGYTDEWEQRKFGDYNDLMTGYPFESDKFSEDGIKLVRGMNVKRGYLDFSEDICVKWNSCVGLENYLLKDGDILIQMDGALIGKSYAKIKKNQLPALLVQRVTRARTNNKLASQDFMYQTIQRDFLRYIGMNKTETAVPHLSLNDIRNFEIMVPGLAEQNKIGTYFSNLDRLITLHQRKCDEIKSLKKYMLQKMFPQNEQKVPEIRFKGFTEAWEQRKLSEIALQTYGGGTPKTANEEFWKGNIPWIQSSDLIEEQLFNVKPRKYISQEAISKSATKLVPQNSIAIVTRVGVGKLAFMPFSYATSQDFLSLSDLKIEPEFAVYALYKMMQLVSNEVQGTSIKGITKDELLAKEILIPGCEEQKKIGAYLHNLDHLITLHQRKSIPHPNHSTTHTKHKGEEKYVRIRVNDRGKIDRTANLRRFPVDIPGRFKN